MSNGNLGVFGWIRDSVRRSVLLGFSDAVEQIGGVTEGDDLHPQLAAVLHDAAPKGISLGSDPPGRKQPKKRLGRSLEQLRNTPRPTDGSA